eukprot:jgi/Botrbrau1/20298/Bobra.31_1s0075.2
MGAEAFQPLFPAYNTAEYIGARRLPGVLPVEPAVAQQPSSVTAIHTAFQPPPMYAVQTGAVVQRVDPALLRTRLPEVPTGAPVPVGLPLAPVALQHGTDRPGQPQPVVVQNVLPGRHMIIHPAPSGASATPHKRSTEPVQDSPPTITGVGLQQSGESNSPIADIPTDGSHVGVSGTAESKAPSPGVQSASKVGPMECQRVPAWQATPRASRDQPVRGEGPGKGPQEETALGTQVVPAWRMGSGNGSDTSDDVVSWRTAEDMGKTQAWERVTSGTVPSDPQATHCALGMSGKEERTGTGAEKGEGTSKPGEVPSSSGSDVPLGSDLGGSIGSDATGDNVPGSSEGQALPSSAGAPPSPPPASAPPTQLLRPKPTRTAASQVHLEWSSRVSNAAPPPALPLWEAGRGGGNLGFKAVGARAQHQQGHAAAGGQPPTPGKGKRRGEPVPLAWGEKRPRASGGPEGGAMLKALRAAIASSRPEAVRQILGDTLYEDIRRTILRHSEEHAHQVLELHRLTAIQRQLCAEGLGRAELQKPDACKPSEMQMAQRRLEQATLANAQGPPHGAHVAHASAPMPTFLPPQMDPMMAALMGGPAPPGLPPPNPPMQPPLMGCPPGMLGPMGSLYPPSGPMGPFPPGVPGVPVQAAGWNVALEPYLQTGLWSPTGSTSRGCCYGRSRGPHGGPAAGTGLPAASWGSASPHARPGCADANADADADEQPCRCNGPSFR